jgi:hypothetical protein
MSEDFVPIAGQPFDPLAAANNRRYVVDLVESSRSLADGPKRLYSTLWRLAITLNRKRNGLTIVAIPSAMVFEHDAQGESLKPSTSQSLSCYSNVYQIPAFTGAGYRFIAFDRRGWGRTVVDPAGPQPGAGADDLLEPRRSGFHQKTLALVAVYNSFG